MLTRTLVSIVSQLAVALNQFTNLHGLEIAGIDHRHDDRYAYADSRVSRDLRGILKSWARFTAVRRLDLQFRNIESLSRPSLYRRNMLEDIRQLGAITEELCSGKSRISILLLLR